MGKTSSKVKDKWNSANYVQIKVSVKPETATAFKVACKGANISMASALSGFMESMSTSTSVRPKGDLLASRGGRRKLLSGLIQQLEEIKMAEEAYHDAIPANFQARRDNADESIVAVEEALDALYGAY